MLCPSARLLPALKTGLIGSNTINAILVLYCITYLQRMMESRRQLAGCEEAMNGLFNNRRINASVVPFMLGCLPAASTVLICGPIVRSAVDDSLTAPKPQQPPPTSVTFRKPSCPLTAVSSSPSA